MHCSTVCSQVVLDRLRQPLFEAVADGDHHLDDALVLHLRKDLQPEPRPFSAVTSPDPCGCRVPCSS